MKFILSLLPFLLILASCRGPQPEIYNSTEIFRYGVASGDPLSSGIILWTHVSPPKPDSLVQVNWELARDEEFKIPIKNGTTSTNSARDYTVKVDVSDLRPGATYYYRFQSYGTYSPTGTTRTAPTGNVDSLKFGIVSCSNYEWGYFNTYAHLAKQKNLMAIIHLGDYIYEYGPGVYGDTTLGRIHEPPYEIVTLNDYRTRYAQYRRDPDLQAAHASHPFITIWDDHEIANNAYQDGAQNHQENEGKYSDRKEIARKVYYEWMPVREDSQLYRAFRFSRLAELYMLDERLAGRSQPVENAADSGYQDSSRAILGPRQYAWFTSNLVQSGSRWKIIGNQVIFSRLNQENDVLNMDAWDGYPVEQDKVAQMLKINQFDNVVFLTGDTHSSWAFEVVLDPFKKEEKPFAIELGTTSINSANSNEYQPDSTVVTHEKVLDSLNPHLKYVNLRDHGYILLTLTNDFARADYYFVTTVKEQTVEGYLAKTFFIKAGEYQLLDSIPD